MGVKQLMGQVTEWFAQIHFIKLLDIGVLMRLAYGLLEVALIESLLALAQNVHIAMMERLTAST